MKQPQYLITTMARDLIYQRTGEHYTTRYISALCKRGILTAHKQGRDWHILRSTVEKFKPDTPRPKNEQKNKTAKEKLGYLS